MISSNSALFSNTAQRTRSAARMVAHALLRAASRLFSTPPRAETPCVGMSADAARRSARATSTVGKCEVIPARSLNPRFFVRREDFLRSQYFRRREPGGLPIRRRMPSCLPFGARPRCALEASFGIIIIGQPCAAVLSAPLLFRFALCVLAQCAAGSRGRSPDLRVTGSRSPSHPAADSGVVNGSSALTVAGPCWISTSFPKLRLRAVKHSQSSNFPAGPPQCRIAPNKDKHAALMTAFS